MTYAAGISTWDAFAPGLALLAFALAILPWLNRDSTAVRAGAAAVSIYLMWRYMFWRITETIPPTDDMIEFAVGLVFLVVEFLSLTGATASLVFLTRTHNRTAEVEGNLPWLREQEQLPLVDVLICTYNENASILERTIVGAQAMTYGRYRVWVCDDGRRAWLRDLCQRMDCGYLTRDDNAHAKAGNINSALRYLDELEVRPDFISILDADFVVRPEFLTRALALTKSPDVGVVQTPQHFFNPDPIQTNLAAAHVWPDEQRFFFDVVLSSKDAWDAAFCCGTSSVIRFEPLMELGGFPTDSVTEDYLVSLRLREQGFRTVYLNEKLSVGLAPEGLKEYVTQRSRWCLGFMQICRGPSGPLTLRNRMPLLERALLIETMLHWSANHLFRLLGLVVPALYLLFDIQAVYANVTEAITYVFPYVSVQLLLFTWMTRGRVLPILADLSQILGATEIVRSAFNGLFRSQGHKFKVTAKGGDRSSRFVQWPMLKIFLAYLALNVAGIAWAFDFDGSRPLADAAGMALFWSWYNIVILLLACFVCIEEAQRRQNNRFASGSRARISFGGDEAEFGLADVSVNGFGFVGDAPAAAGTAVTVQLHDQTFAGHLTRIGRDSFGIEVETTDHTRWSMIRHVFSGRYETGIERIDARRVAMAVAGRVFR